MEEWKGDQDFQDLGRIRGKGGRRMEGWKTDGRVEEWKGGRRMEGWMWLHKEAQSRMNVLQQYQDV